MKNALFAAIAATFVAGAAYAEGDAAAGESTFGSRCKTCHMIETDAGETLVRGGKTGPNLYAVVGRQAGTGADFKRYGKSLVALGESGFVWTEAEIVAYLEDPRAYLRAKLDDGKAKSNMAFKLRGEDDRANVAAYLASVSPGS